MMARQPHVDGHYNNLSLNSLGGIGSSASFRAPFQILFSSEKVNQSSSPLKIRRRSISFSLAVGGGCKRVAVMASSGYGQDGVCKDIKTKNFLRHVESLANIPCGAGKISQLNAVILGEALASEENDLVFPSEDFSRQALIPSPQKVSSL